MTRRMGLEYTIIQMVLSMKVNGLMIFKREKEKRPGKMVLIMKATINKVKNMALDVIFGTTVQFTKVNGLTIRFKVRVLTHGQTVVFMKANGRKIKCTDMAV